MRVRLAGRYVTFSAETDTERSDLELIAGDIARQTFKVDSVNGDTLSLRAMGPAKEEQAKGGKGKGQGKESEAGAEAGIGIGAGNGNGNGALNITFDDIAMPLQSISNLAHTPFTLDGRSYASVEGFWQGLKFDGEADRQRLAGLHGHRAKEAGPSSKPGDRIVYEGRVIVAGTVDHWALMERANRAKFEQNAVARAALLSTKQRPLVHRVPVDSRTIPGIIMADIWTRIRADLSER